MATPGYGVGDIIAVSALAWKLYKAYKDAPEEFQIMSNEILSLHIVLKEVEENLGSTNCVKELEVVRKGCEDVLNELEEIRMKYEASLGTATGSSRHNFSRMTFAKEDIAGLRARVVLNTSLLTVFNSTTIARSQARIEAQVEACTSRIERRLDRLCRRASLTSLASFATINSKEAWKKFFKELHKNGFKADMLTEANRGQFVELYQKKFIDGGLSNEGENGSASIVKSQANSPNTLQRAKLESKIDPEKTDDETPRGAPGTQFNVDQTSHNSEDLGETVDPDCLTPLSCPNSKDLWMQLYSELTSSGISADMIAQKKDRIVEAFKTAITSEAEETGVPDSTEAGWGGTLALHAAARTGRTRLVGLLLHIGVPVDAEMTWNNTLFTPLNLAAYGGHCNIIKILLERGADIEHVIYDGHTPLYTAAWCRHTEAVRILLQHGAKTESQGTRGTPLHRVIAGSFSVVGSKWGTIFDAANNSNLPEGPVPRPVSNVEKIVEVLLANGSNIDSHRDSDGATPLHLAARYGELATVKLLLSKGATINIKDQKDRTFLYDAAAGGHYEIIKLILQLTNKNINDCLSTEYPLTVLGIAAERGHCKAVKMLLEDGARVDGLSQDTDTPLIFTTVQGHEKSVQILLQAGANIQAKSSNEWIFTLRDGTEKRYPPGDTALHIAVRNKDVKMMELLLKHGASLSMTNSGGETPLDAAKELAAEDGTPYNKLLNHLNKLG